MTTKKKVPRKKRRQQRHAGREGHGQSHVAGQPRAAADPRDRALLEEMASDVLQELPPDSEVFINPPSLPKMSDLLLELLGPRIELADSAEDYQRLVLLASIAWNAALIPANERPNFLQKFIDFFPPAARRDVAEVLHTLMVRRQRLFPEDPRYIASVKVTDLGDTYHLAVATHLPPELRQKLKSSPS